MMWDTRKIDKARILKGLSKSGFAKKAGIFPTTYTEILHGQNQYAPTIKKVADALDLSMEEIYIDDQEAKTA